MEITLIARAQGTASRRPHQSETVTLREGGCVQAQIYRLTIPHNNGIVVIKYLEAGTETEPTSANGVQLTLIVNIKNRIESEHVQEEKLRTNSDECFRTIPDEKREKKGGEQEQLSLPARMRESNGHRTVGT